MVVVVGSNEKGKQSTQTDPTLGNAKPPLNQLALVKKNILYFVIIQSFRLLTTFYSAWGK